MELPVGLSTQIILIAALAGWTAMMVQRGIAVYHDGLRHKMGDFVGDHTSREDLIKTGKSLNQSFILWSIPFTLSTNIILAHLLLLPLDMLGIRTRKWWQAAIGGAIWGVVLVLAVFIVRNLLLLLPVNIPALLMKSFEPLIFGVIIIPVVAIAYQFGKAAGIISLVIVFMGYLIQLFVVIENQVFANSLPMIFGLLAVVFFTWRTEQQRKARGEEVPDMSFLETKIDLVQGNRWWFAVQGALLGASVNAGFFGWFIQDTAVIANGFQLQAALVAVMITIGFIPTVTSSTVLTGVSQIVGLTWVFLVAYLAPNPIVAAIAGGIVMLLEVQFLNRINNTMNQIPAIREIGDSMRGALDQVSSILLVAGALFASADALPNGGGYLIVGGIIGLNEMTGTPIMRFAVGPIALIVLGLIASLLIAMGVI